MMQSTRNKKSFRLKLISSYILVVLLSFGVISIFLDKNLESDSINNIELSLVNQARLIESQIVIDNLRNKDLVYLNNLVKTLGQKINCRITIIYFDGVVLADSERDIDQALKMDNHSTRPEVKIALNGNTGADTRYSSTLRMDMLYVALPIKDSNKVAGVLRLALPLDSVQKTLLNIRNIILLSFLFVLGVALVIGSIFARTITKPINRIIDISRKFSEGDFSKRLIGEPRDELGELASTLNNMAQAIEDKIKEVNSQNQELVAIFNSMVEGVIVTDNQGRIVTINPTVERIFSLSKTGVRNKLFLEAIRSTDIAEIVSSVLKDGKSITKESEILAPEHKILKLSASPILEHNSITGCVVVLHDITQIRKLETMRSDFIANVSHELKTPLTSIKGFVETLLEGALEDKKNSVSFLRIIKEHADRLNDMINDLLSLSYLEAREVKLDTEKINIKDLTDRVLSGFKSQQKKKSIEIINDISASISIKADTGKIEQVLTNLIDNAIKYNRDKGIIKLYSQDMGSSVKITVEDSGFGIPEKDIPRIFERFYRVDKARSRELGGTGLGLSIVKHIIELHKGSIGVDSTETVGSKFWFTLPQQ